MDFKIFEGWKKTLLKNVVGNGQLLKLFKFPWEDKAGTSVLDAKSRERNSIDYIDVYNVITC